MKPRGEGATLNGFLDKGSHFKGELTFEDVERVDVPEVDVRVGAALADCVPSPGDGEPVVLAEDPQLPWRRIGDRLAFALGGGQQQGQQRPGS